MNFDFVLLCGIHLWMRNCCSDVVQSFSKTREGGESSSGTCTVVRTSVQNNYDLRPVNFSFVAIAQDQQAEQLQKIIEVEVLQSSVAL